MGRRLAVLLTALALALATTTQAESVLERTVGPLSDGTPLALNGFDANTVGALAFAAGTPFGLELAGRAVAGPHVIAATGAKLRTVLDALVGADPRYEWREDDGVIVILPRGEWIDGSRILDLRVTAIKRSELQATDATLLVGQLLGSGPSGGLDDPKRFSIDLPAGRFFDLLNGVVRAHGAMAWTLEPPRRGDRSAALVGLRANRSGASILVPRIILEPPQILGLALNARQVADNAERAIPDRIVGTRRSGERLVIKSIMFFSELADAVGVPIGVEVGPPAGRGGPEVSIAATGMRLGEVLSAFVTQDPRYEWREMDGVIVIRPKAAWNDSEHPLSKWVENVRVDDAPIADAIDVVLALFGSGPRRSQLADTRRISVNLPVATRLELLNAIVKAHGELCWQWDAIGMPAPFLPREYRHRLGFSWFTGEGGGHGFGVP